jgi:hypothetical protein
MPPAFEWQPAPAWAKWFNHQTRCRGRIRVLPTAPAGEARELDLPFFERVAVMASAYIAGKPSWPAAVSPDIGPS